MKKGVPQPSLVMPAKAGIQFYGWRVLRSGVRLALE
jgi:hypothetical protein